LDLSLHFFSSKLRCVRTPVRTGRYFAPFPDRFAGLSSAIDAETKLVACWYVGQRDAIAATEFIKDLESGLANRVQLTRNGHQVIRST
jgi:hypothetical protein